MYARNDNDQKHLQAQFPLVGDATDLLNLFFVASLLNLKDSGVMGRVFPRGGLVHTAAGVLQFMFRAGSAGLHVSS